MAVAHFEHPRRNRHSSLTIRDIPGANLIPDAFWDPTMPWAHWAAIYCRRGDFPVLLPKAGIDLDSAWTQLEQIATTTLVRYEHRVAAVAWLASRWFDKVPQREIEKPRTSPKKRVLDTSATYQVISRSRNGRSAQIVVHWIDAQTRKKVSRTDHCKRVAPNVYQNTAGTRFTLK